MNKYTFLAVCSIFIVACVTNQKTPPPKQTTEKDSPKPINHSYNLTTKEGINLKVEIDYKLSEFGYLENDCECNYVITNLSNKTLLMTTHYDTIIDIHGKTKVKTKYPQFSTIHFDILTSDGKKIRQIENINLDVLAGYSTESKRVRGTLGKDRYCVDIIPVDVKYKR